MREEELIRGRALSGAAADKISAFVWIVSAGIFAFTVENLWLEPRIRARIHRLPSLVPEPLSGAWVLVLAALVIALTLAAVGQWLLLKNQAVPGWKKASSGAGWLVAAALCVAWFQATAGERMSVKALLTKQHVVTLNWKPSQSPVAGYNVYRATASRAYDYTHPLNSAPIHGLTYADTTVESGHKYFYVTRAVNAQRLESGDSNEIEVDVP